MNRSPLFLLLWLLFVAGFTGSAHAAEAVAFAGQGYGAAETRALTKWLMEEEGRLPALTVERVEAKLDADRFADFKLVTLASFDKAERYTPAECEKIEEWLRGGGKLVLIHQAPKILMTNPTKDREESYLFGRSYYIRDKSECTIAQPDAPLLKEVFATVEKPSWLSGNIRVSGEGWTNLVGDEEGRCLIGIREVGEGKVYFLGNELFRIESGKKPDEIAAWKTLLRNVFLDALGQP